MSIESRCVAPSPNWHPPLSLILCPEQLCRSVSGVFWVAAIMPLPALLRQQDYLYIFLLFFLYSGAILDHLVGVEVIADYLLYVLNQQQQFR